MLKQIILALAVVTTSVSAGPITDLFNAITQPNVTLQQALKKLKDAIKANPELAGNLALQVAKQFPSNISQIAQTAVEASPNKTYAAKNVTYVLVANFPDKSSEITSGVTASAANVPASVITAAATAGSNAAAQADNANNTQAITSP